MPVIGPLGSGNSMACFEECTGYRSTPSRIPRNNRVFTSSATRVALVHSTSNCPSEFRTDIPPSFPGTMRPATVIAAPFPFGCASIAIALNRKIINRTRINFLMVAKID